MEFANHTPDERGSRDSELYRRRSLEEDMILMTILPAVGVAQRRGARILLVDLVGGGPAGSRNNIFPFLNFRDEMPKFHMKFLVAISRHASKQKTCHHQLGPRCPLPNLRRCIHHYAPRPHRVMRGGAAWFIISSRKNE